MGIDLDEPMFTLDDNNEHVMTPIGQKVVDWAHTLPDGGYQGIPGKRKESAVCAAWNSKFKTWVSDFKLTKQEFEHVMAGNAPPRYDMFTGKYYDYGPADNSDPNAELICTDPDLLVIKGSGDGEIPPEETEGPALPERPDRPERDGSHDERKAERDASQAERQAERDARRDERKND